MTWYRPSLSYHDTHRSHVQDTWPVANSTPLFAAQLARARRE